MRDFADDLAALRQRVEEAEKYLDLPGLQARLSALEAEVGRPDLWDDPDAARAATTAYGRVGGDVELLTGMEARLADAETLYQLAIEERDASVEAELVAAVAERGRQLDAPELRVDTYRSSGAGGQHVNVTDSAVRITHPPTGIVVSVQNERSQHQNKAKALQILGAKLAERQREERQAELDAISGPQAEVAWGN